MQVLVSAKIEDGRRPADAAAQNLFPTPTMCPTLSCWRSRTTFDITKMLRNLGFEVPAPVLTQYDWAGGKPFEVQKKTVAMLTTERRAYVLSGFGTGKTKAALWAFDALRLAGSRDENAGGRAVEHADLRLGPGSPGDRAAPESRHPARRARRPARAAQGQTRPTSTSSTMTGSRSSRRTCPRRRDINVLCIDELAVYRNWNKRTKLMKAMAARFEWAWGMTGSPTPNGPVGRVGPGDDPDARSRQLAMDALRDELMLKVGNGFKYVPKKDATENAFKALQPSVRFTLDEVTELPDIVERTVQVGLGPKQQKAYEDHAQAHARTHGGA